MRNFNLNFKKASMWRWHNDYCFDIMYGINIHFSRGQKGTGKYGFYDIDECMAWLRVDGSDGRSGFVENVKCGFLGYVLASL